MASTLSFRATAVELDKTVGFIGFVNDDAERYFWMQPGETEDGISDAKDEIWLERDDQMWGGYGPGWTVTLERECFTLECPSLDFMGCSQIVIEFNITAEKFQELTSQLRTVMSGSPEDLSIQAD